MAESENEWEETLVVAELSGFGDSDVLNREQLNCQVLGIDSENPILQLDNYVFTGQYEDAIGTPLLFKGTPSEPGNGESPLSQLEYMCMTRKKLIMKRAFLHNKSIPESYTVILHDESGDDVEVCPSTSSTAEPTTAKTTAEPTTAPTTSEPTTTTITSEPTAANTTAEPTIVQTTAEPTIVQTTAEPTTVQTTAEPTIVQTTVEPTIVQIAEEPVTVEIIIEPMEVETTVESVTVESSTEQTVVASAEPETEQFVTDASVPSPSTLNVT